MTTLRVFKLAPPPDDLEAVTDAEGLLWRRHRRYRRRWTAGGVRAEWEEWEDLIYHYGPLTEVRDGNP